MNDSRLESTAIRHFVRGTLGCGCPDEVFENINVTTRSDLFAVANTVYEIGGRLFVVVLVPVDWHRIKMSLGPIVESGKKYRDQHGFNRFRLVIATNNDEAKHELPLLFDALPDIDDKTHLHLIDPEQVPRHVPV